MNILYAKIYYGKKCRKCGSEIMVDDVDYNFDSYQNEYLICNNCKMSIFVKVRYGKVCKIEYNDYKE